MTELLLTSEQIGQLVAQFFVAGAGTLSFAVLFASPKRTLPYCGLVGAMGWFIYELAVLFGLESFTASLLAVIPLTLLARIFAIVLKAPVTIFLLAGIFPLAGQFGTALWVALLTAGLSALMARDAAAGEAAAQDCPARHAAGGGCRGGEVGGAHGCPAPTGRWPS